MTKCAYKIIDGPSWRAAEESGRFAGAAVDHADGFIHLSAADQVAETAAKHFAGMEGLLLVAVDCAALGEDLRWEPSRGGALFPHVYGEIPMSAVRWTAPLPLDPDGRHILPELAD